MKYFFLALILILTQPLSPLPRQTIDKQTEKGGAKAQVSDNRQNPPDPSPSIVVMKNCNDENESANAAKNEASNLHQETQKQPTSWSRSDKLTFAYDVLTGLLVCIALGTGVAVAYQAVEMRRATNAMNASTKLQAAAMRQWIDIGPRRIDTKEGITDSEQNEIHFMFQAINNTAYPLTITKIVTWIGYWADTWDTSVVDTAEIVPPCKTKTAPYFFYAVRKCGKADIEALKRGTIYTINGAVYFTDCLGEIQSQGFSGIYDCSPTEFKWREPFGIVPEHEVEHARFPRFRGPKEYHDKYKNPN